MRESDFRVKTVFPPTHLLTSSACFCTLARSPEAWGGPYCEDKKKYFLCQIIYIPIFLIHLSLQEVVLCVGGLLAVDRAGEGLHVGAVGPGQTNFNK